MEPPRSSLAAPHLKPPVPNNFGFEGVPVVRMNNLGRGNLDLSEAARISPTFCNGRVALKAGDLLWGMSGSVGETGSLGNYVWFAELRYLPCQLNQRVGRFITCDDRIAIDLVEWIIQSKQFYEQILLLVTGTAQFNVSPEQVQSCIVAFPPLPEQTAIATFLDRETGKIDALVAAGSRAWMECS